MNSITLSQKIRALQQERVLSDWERDFVSQAYAASLGGSKIFHLSQKQQENIEVIFEKIYH